MLVVPCGLCTQPRRRWRPRTSSQRLKYLHTFLQTRLLVEGYRMKIWSLLALLFIGCQSQKSSEHKDPDVNTLQEPTRLQIEIATLASDLKNAAAEYAEKKKAQATKDAASKDKTSSTP